MEAALRLLNLLCFAAAVLIAAVASAWIARVSTIWRPANLGFSVAALAGYPLIVVRLWMIRNARLRAIVAGASSIPLVPLLLFAPVMAIPGAIIAADILRPPEHIEQMQERRTCEIDVWGWAMTEGFTVRIYEPLPAIPFLRRQVASDSMVESDPTAQGPEPTCASVAKQAPRP